MKKVIDVIHECKKLSFEDSSAFPEVVRRLMECGIERYQVDLFRLERTYYSKDESYRIKFELPELQRISEEFSETGVREAIRAIQHSEINYITFLDNIMNFGVVSYIAFLKGAQVHYIGAKGEVWIEHFPRKA